MANFCGSCGTRLNPAAKFCSGCGNPINAPKPTCPTCGQDLPQDSHVTDSPPLMQTNNHSTQSAPQVSAPAQPMAGQPVSMGTKLPRYGIEFVAGQHCGNCGFDLQGEVCASCGTDNVAPLVS